MAGDRRTEKQTKKTLIRSKIEAAEPEPRKTLIRSEIEYNTRKRKQNNETLNRSKIEDEAAAEPEALKTLNPPEIEKKNITITGEGGGGDEQWRDWASMTEPLLQSILSLLTTLQAFSSFRSVCKGWRSIAVPNRENLCRQSPLLLYHHSVRHTKRTKSFRHHHSARHTNRTKSFRDLAEMRCYAPPLPFGLRTSDIGGYSHGCIIAIPSNRSRRILLCDIITRKITRLPRTNFDPYEILLSGPPSSPACIALIIGFEPVIIYCRIGDRHWTELRVQRHMVKGPKHIVFIRERLHFLLPCFTVGIVDFASPEEITFLEPFKLNAKISIGANNDSTMYLAELGRDLLLVNTGEESDMMYNPSHWEGYKIWCWDFEGGSEPVEVTSLGERALFIGGDGSATSILATAGSGVRGNCIYHTHFGICGSNCGWTVYSLDDRTLSVVLPESFGFSIDNTWMIPPVWIFPSLYSSS